MPHADYPTIIEERLLKARVTHICCECQREIKPGTRYKRVKGAWSGKWSRYNVCIPCDKLRTKLACADGLPAFEEVQEWAANEGIPFPPGRSTADFVDPVKSKRR
jgi:hypothetical protein